MNSASKFINTTQVITFSNVRVIPKIDFNFLHVYKNKYMYIFICVCVCVYDVFFLYSKHMYLCGHVKQLTSFPGCHFSWQCPLICRPYFRFSVKK